MKTATKPPVLDRWWGPFRLRYDQPPESIARSPILSQRCIPMAQERPDGHYLTPGDVTCECGAYPTEMGARMGLRAVPTRRRSFMWALLGLLLGASTASAQALIISAPGTYTLSADATGSGLKVVQIDADNVVLDLNGRVIRCTPSDPSTALTFGIYAPERANITIKRGTITGCLFAIHGGYGSGFTLEDLALGGNTYIGAHLVGGSGNIVRRVTCHGMGGYTLETYRICINGIGSNGLIEDLTATDIYRGAGTKAGEGVGVLIDSGAVNAIVRRFTHTQSTHQPNTIALWAPPGGTFSELNVSNLDVGVTGANASVTNSAFTLTAGPSGIFAVNGLGVVATNSIFTGYAPTPYDSPGNDGGGNVVVGGEEPPPPPPPPPPPSGTPFRLCLGVGFTQCIEGIIPPPGG